MNSSRPVVPLRSVLYMPGANARALEKAKTLDADALILDLEDSVAPDAKAVAREQVAAAVKAGGYGRRLPVVRINALTTPWGHADLAAAVHAGAKVVLIPKVDGADAVREVEMAIHEIDEDANIKLWAMLETPRGILRADEIAGSSFALKTLVMGTSDLAKDLHCHHTRDREPMVTSLGLCLLAARAHNKAIVDGVCLDLDDMERFEAECLQGRHMGFDGKTLIHPKTVAVANRVFAPDAEEIATAKKISVAHAQAQAEGKGVTVVDGKLIEYLHVQTAERVLAMARAVGALEEAGE
ncbi:MAG: CoA ester lyase [Rhodospirillaceae bacterium]|nr:CoA ester lyase [Rhodospirillaceae bacterium]